MFKRCHLENIFPLAFTLISVWIIYAYYKNQYYNYGGIVLIAIGLILWWTGKITMGDAFTMLPKAKKLITTGIYSKIRHPIYLGFSLTVTGWAIFLFSPGWFITALITILFLTLRVHLEEKALLKKYGEVYQKYKNSTWF